MLKLKLAMVGACVAAISLMAAAAHADTSPIDPDKVKALAIQIENALAAAGPSATAAQDVATIQSIIAASGVSPSEAEAALEVVQASAGLSPNASVAVASVDKQIELALAGSAAAAGGGPGGGAPIGAPPAYVSGGGSNYLTP
jgi:hypothetical protein